MNISVDVFPLITECTQMCKNMLITKLFLERSWKIAIRYDDLMSGVDNHIIHNIYVLENKVSHILIRGWHILLRGWHIILRGWHIFPPVLLQTKSWVSINISVK
jgi:hypothetical protein